MPNLPTNTASEAIQDDPRAKILSDIEELSSLFDWRVAPDKHGNHQIGHEQLQRLLLDLKLLHKAVGALPVAVPTAAAPGEELREPRFFIDHGMIHDRATGKHVDCEPDFMEFPDGCGGDPNVTRVDRFFGIQRTCDLLNELANAARPQLAAAPGEEAFRHALQLIADFPIREQDSMPSANMRAVAVAALAGAISKPVDPQLAGEEAVAEIWLKYRRGYEGVREQICLENFTTTLEPGHYKLYTHPTPSLAGQTHSANEADKALSLCIRSRIGNDKARLLNLFAMVAVDGSACGAAKHEARTLLADIENDCIALAHFNAAPSQTHSAPGDDEARDAALFRALAKAAHVEDRDGGWASFYRLPYIARHDGSTYDGAKPWGPLTFVEACQKAFPAAIAKDSA